MDDNYSNSIYVLGHKFTSLLRALLKDHLNSRLTARAKMSLPSRAQNVVMLVNINPLVSINVECKCVVVETG